MSKLPRHFYEREDVVRIARELLGKILFTQVSGMITAGKITEIEAYNGRTDRACHAYQKVTSRTQVMYGRGGMSYVYLIYGLHNLFNVVTNKSGYADAVLIRAIEPVKGADIMAARRGIDKQNRRLTAGPGSLSKAMGIARVHNKLDLRGNAIWIEDAPILADKDITTTTRIGVDYAGEDAKLPWRFYETRSEYVSKR